MQKKGTYNSKQEAKLTTRLCVHVDNRALSFKPDYERRGKIGNFLPAANLIQDKTHSILVHALKSSVNSYIFIPALPS